MSFKKKRIGKWLVFFLGYQWTFLEGWAFDPEKLFLDSPPSLSLGLFKKEALGTSPFLCQLKYLAKNIPSPSPFLVFPSFVPPKKKTDLIKHLKKLEKISKQSLSTLFTNAICITCIFYMISPFVYISLMDRLSSETNKINASKDDSPFEQEILGSIFILWGSALALFGGQIFLKNKRLENKKIRMKKIVEKIHNQEENKPYRNQVNFIYRKCLKFSRLTDNWFSPTMWERNLEMKISNSISTLSTWMDCPQGQEIPPLKKEKPKKILSSADSEGRNIKLAHKIERIWKHETKILPSDYPFFYSGVGVTLVSGVLFLGSLKMAEKSFKNMESILQFSTASGVIASLSLCFSIFSLQRENAKKSRNIDEFLKRELNKEKNIPYLFYLTNLSRFIQINRNKDDFLPFNLNEKVDRLIRNIKES